MILSLAEWTKIDTGVIFGALVGLGLFTKYVVLSKSSSNGNGNGEGKKSGYVTSEVCEQVQKTMTTSIQLVSQNVGHMKEIVERVEKVQDQRHLDVNEKLDEIKTLVGRIRRS